MSRKILTVEDTFLIQGRGLIIVARPTDEFTDFKLGDSIQIENPDKTFIVSKIKAIDILCVRPFDDKRFSFVVGSEIKKEQIHKNASISLLENES